MWVAIKPAGASTVNGGFTAEQTFQWISAGPFPCPFLFLPFYSPDTKYYRKDKQKKPKKGGTHYH